jgi:hypothetical protein
MDSTPFSIRELTGDRRFLVLLDRALPYRPIHFPTKQRGEFTWYPGNPIATSQMLGAEIAPTTIHGYWKDRFLQQGVAGAGTPQMLLNGSVIPDVRTLVEIFEDITRKGQLLQITWDTFIREGHLTEFDPAIHNVHDVEWSAVFTWISQGDVYSPSVLPRTATIADNAADWLLLDDSVGDLIQNPELPPGGIFTGLEAKVASFKDTVGTVQDIASVYLDNVLSKLEIAQRLAATCSNVIDNANDVIDAIEAHSLPGLVVDNVVALAPLVTLGESTRVAAYRRKLINYMRAARYDAANQMDDAALQVNPSLIGTFVARARTDLRDVSSRFYGTPDQWQKLMRFNGLPSSRVDAGTVIYVPRLDGDGA